MYNEAVSASNRGEPDKAVSLLEQVIAQTTDPVFRRKAQADLDLLQESLRHNRAVDRYNHAIKLANQGKLSEAIEILEEVLAEDPGDRLRPEVERTLGDFKETTRGRRGRRGPR